MNFYQATEKNISQILNDHQLVILDFYANWCEPCKIFSPVFENVSKKYPAVGFGKVNTETEHVLASDFSIRSIPTIVILKEHTIIFERSGHLFEHQFIDLIEAALKINVSTLPTEE